MAIDGAPNIYVAGGTYDNDFPVTPGAYQTIPPNGYGEFAFLTEINSTGTSVVFSSYFGGSPALLVAQGSAIANGIGFDPSGNIIIAGNTYGLTLPASPGVISQDCGGHCDAGFIAKFSPEGSKLIWSTFVPGVFQATAVGPRGLLCHFA